MLHANAKLNVRQIISTKSVALMSLSLLICLSVIKKNGKE